MGGQKDVTVDGAGIRVSMTRDANRDMHNDLFSIGLRPMTISQARAA
jgi:hypothetical protein